MHSRSIKLALIVGTLAAATSCPAAGTTLELDFVPRFNGADLSFDAMKYSTPGGQSISFTRLDLLVSDVSLHTPAGAWISSTDQFGFIGAREHHTRLTITNAPEGDYDRIRFHIGLPPAINQSDPSTYPAGHALNPEVNGLYWGWTGGYVFLALEGAWRESSGKLSGYSFHLATAPQLMTVELPANLHVRPTAQLALALNLERVFSNPNRLTLSETANSTHSRTNDVVANLLRQNLEQAFTVIPAKANPAMLSSAMPARHTEMAASATPYRLTFSRFFPQPALPADNPLTEEGVALGRRLFFDRRLSVNNSQACASCHQRRFAMGEHKEVSRGAEGREGTRNAMPLLNLAWKSSYFWDGRAPTLREQVLMPIQNPIEMHESLPQAVTKLREAAAGRPAPPGRGGRPPGRGRPGGGSYGPMFAAAFGTPEITSDRMARALEQFLLVQVSYDSKFDRVLNGQETFTLEEQKGLELFNTEYDPAHGQHGADCFHCHGGPLFRSQDFANNGLDSTFRDLGRFATTKRNGDQGKFAVPSLRNVELSAPYMHDGRFRTLEEVVEHYSTGLHRSATLDPNLAKHPGNGVPLSASDKQALVAFLKTLTDENLARAPFRPGFGPFRPGERGSRLISNAQFRNQANVGSNETALAR